jgi:FAD/FMN-containing dehydrogenase
VRLETIPPSLISRFAEIVGEANAVTRADEQAGYLREWRDRYTGRTPVVLRPNSTEQVSRILTLAHEHGVGIVPQAGNTGLVGGQIPSMDGDQIVLSVERMTRVRDVDAVDGTILAEAGVTLAGVQDIAESIGRLFPLSMASEGSARVGGFLATNAGGTGVLAYGNARQQCLGLEVVLADGRVWNDLKRLKKDNSGYDLRDLMIGSEGTLGIITAAVLKTVTKPVDFATAIAAVPSIDAALALFHAAETAAGDTLTGFEFWTGDLQQIATAHMAGVRAPLDHSGPWFVLIEVSEQRKDGSARALLRDILDEAFSDGVVTDAAEAQSLAQRKDFWALRESFSEAQKHAGGSIKHDVSVPVAKVSSFLKAASEAVQRVCPGARPMPFGHLGDGNVHYNITQPPGMDKATFLALWEAMPRAVHDVVAQFDGSISAEHGIGQMKRDELVRYRCDVSMDIMRSIKRALDPKGILNPGKVL